VAITLAATAWLLRPQRVAAAVTSIIEPEGCCEAAA
jgi:hypothetical protein